MLSTTKATIIRKARAPGFAVCRKSIQADRSVSRLLPRQFTSSVPSLSLHSSLKLQREMAPAFRIYRGHQRSIFIQSEETPNPESIKFIPTGIVVLADTDGNGYFVTRSDPQDAVLRSPLAKDLFKIDHIKSVYLGADFVTITKFAQGNWKSLRPEILNVLMTFFDTDMPALRDQPLVTDTTILDDDCEIVAMIKELIESRIRPAVQEDGGDIRYVSFEEGTGLVTVELAGSCVGCPSSSVTLKQGVENMLQHYIPEVTAVVALEEEQNDKEGEEPSEEEKKQKTYEERLKASGIPFSD